MFIQTHIIRVAKTANQNFWTYQVQTERLALNKLNSRYTRTKLFFYLSIHYYFLINPILRSIDSTTI